MIVLILLELKPQMFNEICSKVISLLGSAAKYERL